MTELPFPGWQTKPENTAMTAIEWTDAIWNPFAGCSVVSPGCTNCYAMRQAWRLAHNPITPQYQGTVRRVNGHSVWTGKINLAEHKLADPLRWRSPRMVFVNSMSDLFHEGVPDAWIVRVFAVMRQAPNHAYQVLTKRPERIAPFLARAGETIPDCCWLGVSVEPQDYASRVDALRSISAPVRALSCEPLLGPLNLDLNGIHWVIVGGESGPRRRMMNPNWARSIRDQYSAAGVAFFMKQMTGKAPIPEDLMVRQWPAMTRSGIATADSAQDPGQAIDPAAHLRKDRGHERTSNTEDPPGRVEPAPPRRRGQAARSAHVRSP
jgi:protein gp37